MADPIGRRGRGVRFTDTLRTAWAGVTSRRQRAALAALGIALGIASFTALTGISASNQAKLLTDLDRMGANLAVVTPASAQEGRTIPLPQTAPATIARLDQVADVGVLETPPEGLNVYRSEFIPSGESGGIGVAIARPDLLDAIGARLRSGRWFDDATRGLPAVVLGSAAAQRLGITSPGDQVWIGQERYGVLGILEPAGLASDIDTSAILGDAWVREHHTGDGLGEISALYVRAQPGTVSEVAELLAAAASPGSPTAGVYTLSELAEARQATDESLTTLGLALGGIALLVGAVGIANTMVVTVLERRGEIGLRRSLGARPLNIATQFVTEAALLAVLGGLAGLALGVAAAAGYAVAVGQPVVLPMFGLASGLPVAVLAGALAGLMADLRAAKVSPKTALSAT